MREITTKKRCYMGVCGLAAAVGVFLVFMLMEALFERAGLGEQRANDIGRVLATAAALAVYHKMFGLRELGLGKKNFLHGMLTGGFMIFVTVLNTYVIIAENLEYPVVMPAFGAVAAVIATEIFVGIFEEFLFRGLLLKSLLAGFGEHRFAGKMAAVFVSSLIFGLTHFFNLQDQMVNSTISQVITATYSGIFWAVLYLRVRNIWVVACYHTVTNLAGSLPILFFEIPDSPNVDISVGDIFSVALANLVLLAAALFLARKLREKKEQRPEALS